MKNSASYRSIMSDGTYSRPAGEPASIHHDASQNEKLWSLMANYLATDTHTIQRSIANHIEFTLGASRFDLDDAKVYLATAHSVRDRLIESWNDSNTLFESLNVKQVAYLSLEFLVGRSMQNALLNLDLEDNYRTALREIGYDLEKLYDQEQDAALGNGGLGRLAACFLDSMATLDLPAFGYGIKYRYGFFKQLIRNGTQYEAPDYWLTHGNPWEIERIDLTYPVRYYGHVEKETVTGPDGKPTERSVWRGGEVVQAIAYDNPVPGYAGTASAGSKEPSPSGAPAALPWVINLRLFKSAPSKEFDLASFNTGDYIRAVDERQRAETISHVLYPADSTASGKELRLKQQYFFVSATLRDIIRRFKRHAGWRWSQFADKNAVQLNDTHPSIGIAELMRILVDEEGLAWEEAWEITVATFAYTNHTILPEALEKWSVDLMGHLLPRHLEIIYRINWDFMEAVKAAYAGAPDLLDRMRRMSIIEEGPVKMVRMAHLAMVGAHATNGVAAIHTELLKSVVFPDFHDFYPGRFKNMTNGVTPRRWVNQCNPALSRTITRWLGSGEWLKDLDALSGLRALADAPELQAEWAGVKTANKERLAAYIRKTVGISVNPSALFDIQVKRIHEYKRQLLNALYCIYRYNWIKSLPPRERAARVVPRVVVFAGKAAPSYDMAKRIIRLIHRIGEVVNADPEVNPSAGGGDAAGDLLKVVFLPNYNVSSAELIIPASDISQHISTAGMEASGTSNMKFCMNGGLLMGTLDGANIEIAAEVDRANLFIFGAEAHEVPHLRHARKTQPASPYCKELQAVLKDLQEGKYGPLEEVGPILSTLEWSNDFYLTSHDFPDYIRAQSEADAVFRNPSEWTRRSILCVAGMGKFSTDRTISEYASEIWGVEPVPRAAAGPAPSGMERARSFPSLVEPVFVDEGPAGGEATSSSAAAAAAGGAGAHGKGGKAKATKAGSKH